MAFQRKRKVYKLDFEETEYEGLEVRVGGLTTGEYLDLIALSGPTEEGDGEAESMLRMFAEHLVSWNLTDEEGQPVPTTFDGLRTNDFSMNSFMINAWTDAMTSVPVSTGKKSLAGDPTLVASIPTESLL